MCPYSSASRHKITELNRQQWHDLDRLLAQFWTSHSIRPKVAYEVEVEKREDEDIRDHAPSLLPELTRRGFIDLVECAEALGVPASEAS